MLSLKTNPGFLDFEDNLLSSRYKAIDFIELQVPKRVVSPPDVVATVNRHKLSCNAFNDVFAAIMRASSGNSMILC